MTTPVPKKTAKKSPRKAASPGASADDAVASFDDAAAPAGAVAPRATAARGAAPEDALPGPEEIAAMLAPVRAFMHGREHARIRGFLQRLAQAPPQVLLLEGGTPDERLAAAHYWALLLNCDPQAAAPPPPPAPAMMLPGLALPAAAPVAPAAAPAEDAERPCLDCPVCVRMVTHLHRDCFFLDGTAGSIKIDDVRAVRSVLGEPPREARFRMVIFREAQALGEAAANALLKSFEEPRPGASFVMLAPQRERLLPTLVSRSVVLTLPWPRQEDPAVRESLAPFEAALCNFLRTGRGLFEISGVKGAVDAPLVQALTGLCRRALAVCIKARKGGPAPGEGLEDLLARLPETRLRMLDEALAECQDSLVYGVNPALVLEWLATRMYLLQPRS